MPKTRAEKEVKTQEVAERLQTATAVYLADLTGMSVEKLTSFRRVCRENGVRLEVVKNTLINRATKGSAYEKIVPHLEGPTALMTTTADAVSPARVLEKFIKENKGIPKVKAACLDGDLLTRPGCRHWPNSPAARPCWVSC